jgi:hypothetical protein
MLATVATTGSYNSLINTPTLGTAAAKDIPASGDASTSQIVYGTDSRLTDARTPTAHNQAWSTITSTPTTLSGYGITDAQKAITISDTAPVSPATGDLWYKSNTGAMYIRYDSFWIEVGSPSSGLDGGSA